MTKTPKISVVILNWNRAEDTLECLKSLGQLQILNYKLQIIVVDNASQDGSVKKLKKYRHEKGEYQLIINKRNLGYAGGMNTGIRPALSKGADYVVLLNNDTSVSPGLLEDLLSVAREDEKAGVLCPKIYFAKGFEFHKKRYKKNDLGKVIWYAGGDIDWKNVYGSNHGVDEVDRGQYDEIRETDFATGNCMFVSSEALKKNGLFDERYFMYLEDVDLCVRYKKSGWKILYVPKAQLWHKVAQSSGIGSQLNDYFISRNRMLFGMRYAPLRAKAALVRESIRLLAKGRKWEKAGVKDFYLRKFGKGSWQ